MAEKKQDRDGGIGTMNLPLFFVRALNKRDPDRNPSAFPRVKFWLANLSAVILAIALYEIYLTIWPPRTAHYETMAGYAVPDSELGYALKKGPFVAESIVKDDDGTILFDAHYGLDQNGIRLSIEPATPKNDHPVWFVGDSFTFGVGLNDDDTLPSQFAKLSNLRVINFGIGGQGAHQVLRELETDRPGAAGAHDPLAIVYIVLPNNHMFRASGRVSWDQNGPRYEIVNGNLEFVGHFSPHVVQENWLSRSAIYKKLITSHAPPEFSTITQKDRERLLAIILKCRDLSVTKYHAPFYVLVWRDDVLSPTNSDWLIDKLKNSGVQTLDLAVAIPGLLSGKYIIPKEGHPTAEANRLVARVLEPLIAERPALEDQHSLTQSLSSSLSTP
jgi:hypothetical protein